MDGQNVDESNSAINISDVIEVIETDCAATAAAAAGSSLMNQPSSVRRSSDTTPAVSVVCNMPYIKIVEQPASKALRFRYECEGRSAGSIPGVNSTPENKTYPTIQIVGYRGKAIVVVSCVTKDSPYRPHPHNLVGKESCKKGICTVEINNETMTAAFANLGIQCVKKKDIEEALRIREDIRVDPFRTGFSHKTQTSSIDLNSVRLCFQAFLEGPQRGKFTTPLQPVVSEPIYDKKAMADLVICKLSHCSGSVAGGNEIILLCEKVAKEDISVRFYEEKDGQVVWESLGDFTPTQVHKQVAISFRTPRYKTLDIDQPVQALIQLRRPSDNATSEALPFQITPLDSGRPFFWSLRRSIGQKADYRTFSTILQTNTKLLNQQEQQRIVEDANNNNNSETTVVNVIKDEMGDRIVSVANVPQPKVVVVTTNNNINSNEDDELLKTDEENNVVAEQSDLEQLLVKDLENICNNNSDLGVYTSLQMALKNPCEDLLDQESYEDITPPRPTAAKPLLNMAQPLSPAPSQLEDDALPPLPPKRAKRTGPDTKSLPPPPTQKKAGLFQKLFSTNKRKKNKEIPEKALQSRGSIKSLPADMMLATTTSTSPVIISNEPEPDITEAEHYALYTSVAPHATASEFDEMSFYYSSVEQQKVN